VDAQIAAHADEPCLEVRATVERAQRLEDLQEDVLRQIFGFVVLADELVRDVEDLAPMETDDLLPGVLVACQTPLDELIDAGRLRGRLIRRHGEGPSYPPDFSPVKPLQLLISR